MRGLHGRDDIERQALNVYRMKLLGATVVPVTSGSKTLKDALNEAMRDWVTNVENTFYIIGTVAGPHPYPMMVRDFNAVIGRECARADARTSTAACPMRWSPASAAARNAMGIFHPFLNDRDVRIVGVEAAGEGIDSGRHAASLSRRAPGRAARQPHLPAAGRRRPDHRDAFGVGRPRLSRRRSRARLAEGHRARRVRRRHRRRGAGGVPPAGRTEGIIAGARIQPRDRPRDEARPRRCRRTRSCCATCPGRGDKDMHTIAARARSGAAKLSSRMSPACAAHSRERLDSRMNRIDTASPAAAGRKALMPFVTAGDPSLEATVPVHARAGRGRRRRHRARRAVLRSDGRRPGDPAQFRARAGAGRGLAVRAATACASSASATTQTPVVLMGYLNPIEIRGAEHFAADAVAAGVDGVLLVDLPPEELGEFRAAFAAHGLALDPAGGADHRRMRACAVLCDAAQGYLYYVSFAGVTGADRPRRRRGGRSAARDPGAQRRPGRRGLRHQGRRVRRRDGAASRRRGGRQRAGRRHRAGAG